jgi:hypothetical protein
MRETINTFWGDPKVLPGVHMLLLKDTSHPSTSNDLFGRIFVTKSYNLELESVLKQRVDFLITYIIKALWALVLTLLT